MKTFAKFDKKDVICWGNRDNASQGMLGYVGDSLTDLENNITPETLVRIIEIDDPIDALCFTVIYEQDESNKLYHYGFFLPVDKVKGVKEKKWRAFTLEEFNKTISMGTVFKYRFKEEKAKRSIYYHAYLELENGGVAIFFEKSYRSLNYAFEELELFLNEQWQPFGIKE